MKRHLFLILTVLLNSCLPEPQNKHLEYQNIIILSDMSSRIRNERFPSKDVEEIKKIVQYFRNECVKPGEKIGDRSSITFSALTRKTKIQIDLGQFKNLADKQSFINSTGKFANNGLNAKINAFNDSVQYFYNSVKDPGMDLISILMERIHNDNIIYKDKIISNGIDTTVIHYNNHMYIFTDGYLEYALAQKTLNPQYYFGVPEIERIRQYCKKNDVNVKTALEKNPSLGLPASKGKFNQLINLHILETNERDKDVKLQTYRHAVGLRDNEILETVWRKWTFDSGFKSFEWKKY